MQVSPALSAIFEALVNDPAVEESITLGYARRRVAGGLLGKLQKTERPHFGSEQTMLAEIDTLIDRYGEEAPAVDFVTAKASEQLSRVIEAMMSDANTPQRPTLGAVREAMTRGLVARLVGEGAIDPDEDDTLLGEIDDLIERFGESALAEPLMRYE
ncbi:MAG TPA: hypothetical protein VF814_09120 [Casimicrobiaceae bacterium]